MNWKEEHRPLFPTPSPGRAAAEPGACPDAGQDRVPGGGLDARYEQLRHAALHTRAEAFPLGLGVLARGGVTAWRHALASLTPTPATSGGAPARQPPGTRPAQAADLPAPVATELIHVLAAVALARAVPGGPAP